MKYRGYIVYANFQSGMSISIRYARKEEKKMKMKIDVGRLTYTPFESYTRPSYPLPIGIRQRAEIEIFGQLRRTRDGGVDWRFDNANIEFSVSFPRIHLKGDGYIETYPYREFLKPKPDSDPTLQILRRYGRNFLLILTFYRKMEDLFKREEKIKFLSNVFEEIKHRTPEVRQGHLRGYYFLGRVKLPEGLYNTGKRLRVLNHEFSCRKPFQWIECDYGGSYSLFICCPKEEILHVVSPDHLDSPFPLSLSTTGCYYFKHPEPVDDDTD